MYEGFRPDIIITDRDRRPVVVVEVKRSDEDEASAVTQLRRVVDAVGDDETFAMLANPKVIRLYSGMKQGSDPLSVISAISIYRYYDEEYDEDAPLYEPYLTTLVEAWLNDLSVHWHPGAPPGESELPPEFLKRLQAA